MIHDKKADGLIVPISSLRDRAARYQESAFRFERLAAADPVEAFRDQWQAIARDYAFLVLTLVR